MKRSHLLSLILILAFAQHSRAWQNDSEQALLRARAVADRVMRETILSLRAVPSKPLLNLQVVDFQRLFGRQKKAAAYAWSTILCGRDTVLRFGISHDAPLCAWVNGRRVYEHSTARAIVFREIGYDLYHFNDTIEIPLHKGENTILLKTVFAAGKNVVFLKELTSPRATPASTFESNRNLPGATDNPWSFVGPFVKGRDLLQTVFPPEEAFSDSYEHNGKTLRWRQTPPMTVSEIVIRSDAAYTRESYAEWMYPSGTVLLSFLHLADATGDPRYAKFVESVCDFTLRNLPLLRRQYEDLHLFRGADYRIFRRSMLDDTGAPVLPYVELLPRVKSKDLRALVHLMGSYVSKGQVRLPDGTLCRYEPAAYTIWADDLFMSTPFLLRLGEQSKDQKYFDDVARQIINFNRYLVDAETGIYHHGYYEFRKEQSPVLWGRANGWIVWAHSEALLHLPKSHPSYKTIAGIFRRHIESLVAVQGNNGLWHQILNDADTFEETSCTAMFMIGMARGMRLGILDTTFKEPFDKALKGLLKKISDDGIIKDICRGTEISNDPKYYMTRERFDNDPRGLGAVVTACIESMMLEDWIRNGSRSR